MEWRFIVEEGLRAAVDFRTVAVALAAIGLYLQFRFGRLLNLGQIGFVAVGAYGFALSVMRWNIESVFVAALVAVGLAATAALVIGLLTLRLPPWVLGITTLAGAELMRRSAVAISASHFEEGTKGLNTFIGPFRGLNPFEASQIYGFGPWRYRGEAFFAVTVAWALLATVLLVLFVLFRSEWGATLKTVPSEPSIGGFWRKLVLLTLGGAIGGLAGVILAMGNATVVTETFTAPHTLVIWLLVLLSPARRFASPCYAAIVFAFGVSLSRSVLMQMAAAEILPADIFTARRIDLLEFWIAGLGVSALLLFNHRRSVVAENV